MTADEPTTTRKSLGAIRVVETASTPGESAVRFAVAITEAVVAMGAFGDEQGAPVLWETLRVSASSDTMAPESREVALNVTVSALLPDTPA